MNKNKRFAIRVFATNIAISFFFASIFIVCFYVLFNDKITAYTNLINTTAVKSVGSSNENKSISLDVKAKRLTSYPEYGKKYATLKIPAIELELPIYYGDNLSILRYGVGHYAGSYFPGEGGSIILAAHNTKGFFQRFEELNVGDEVTIEANYGTFKYKIDSYKVVKETDLDSFPVQDEEELLIMYTCYPINKSVIGRRTQRYVVYAIRIGEVNEEG